MATKRARKEVEVTSHFIKPIEPKAKIGSLDIRSKFDLTEKQKIILRTLLEKETKCVFIDGLYGSSKAQPLDAKVLTPFGFVKMGDLKTGDVVSTPDGKSANVIGIFPQGIKKVYKVTFSDGSSTECCGEHLWFTNSYKERNHQTKHKNSRKTYVNPLPGKVRNTLEILKDVELNHRSNHTIPISQPVTFFNQNNLGLHPYLMGVLLGDGSFRGYSVTLSSGDEEIMSYIRDILPKFCHVKKKINNKYDYSFTDSESSWVKKNKIKKAIESYGLWGLYSHEKFIPEDYLFASVEDRIELLRGLMDTDGTTDGYNSSYSTTSYKLAENVKFLVLSLGGTSRISEKRNFYTYKGQYLQGKNSYNVIVKMPKTINPFKLKRKADLFIPPTKYPPRRFFSKIEEIGEKECQCILIDSDDHLYITDDFIVTHNTYLCVMAALIDLNKGNANEVIYVRNPVESSTSGTLGWLAGSVKEKLAPWAEVFYSKVKEFVSESDFKYLEENNLIKVLPIGFVRGLNLSSKIIIVDEASSMTYDDIFLIMTRCGPDTKIFMAGDSVNQSDIGHRSGFLRMIRHFDDQESRDNHIFHFELKEESDILRSEFVKFLMRKTGLIKKVEQ